MTGIQRALFNFALGVKINHGGHDHALIVIKTVELPFIRHVGVFEVDDGAIRRHGEYVITRFGGTKGFQVGGVICIVAARAEQCGHRPTRAGAIGDDAFSIARHDAVVVAQIAHGGFEVNNRGWGFARVLTTGILRGAPACTRCSDHITLGEGDRQCVCTASIARQTGAVGLTRHVAAHGIGEENRRSFGGEATDFSTVEIHFRNVNVHSLVLGVNGVLHINDVFKGAHRHGVVANGNGFGRVGGIFEV